jgi:EAL domain-containing protein (putative c-di-GMP-specific phosphodiesterase class I)
VGSVITAPEFRPQASAERMGASPADICFEEQPPGAVAFVLEASGDSSELLMRVADATGVRCKSLTSCGALLKAFNFEFPDLILLDVTGDGSEVVQALYTLRQHGFPGTVQLMSEPGAAMLMPLQNLARMHASEVRPPLAKPLDASTLRAIFAELKPMVAPDQSTEIRLEYALRNNWVQFWYQPKIDLRTKTLVGLEAFVRLFHPHRGLVLPALALKNATERSLSLLANRALIESGVAAREISALGLNPSIAVNVSLKALQTLPVTAIARDYFAATGQRPKWIFDLTEEDVFANRSVMRDVGALLKWSDSKVAIDNCSGAPLPLAALRELPIAEIKLAPACVARCADSRDDAAACQSLIDLAHAMGKAAVAIGVETGAHTQALERMGCDIGQGFLFGQPLPLHQLARMIRQRAVAVKSTNKS